mgnify:CR=1 FL=1
MRHERSCVALALQVERLLPLCECVHVIKRFVETRSQIQYPMVAQVGRTGDGISQDTDRAAVHRSNCVCDGAVWPICLAILRLPSP